ncbi:MAG: hypothetical protein K1X81_01670 [Bacteroidia bacterium]|nr:hypothetical protein [Bacteroidia bacterium]
MTKEKIFCKDKKRRQELYWSRKTRIVYKKYLRREAIKHSRNRGWLKFLNDARVHCKKTGKTFYDPYYYRTQPPKIGEKPEYSDTFQYISSVKNAFSNDPLPSKENGYFLIPKIFSLIEEDYYAESLFLLKRLFNTLYHQTTPKIILDYSECERIDVDASVCLDILIHDYYNYYRLCRRQGHSINLTDIRVEHFQRPSILKVLFSIGAFASIRGISIKFEDVEPYRLCMADNSHPHASKNREVHITELVDYVIACMKKMKRILTPEAEEDLFKVIGEVLINAEEHSTGKKRFSIGYFQDSTDSGEHIGIFNLVILNFGHTIYEKFSDPDCPNKKVVEQMKDLSSSFTKKGLFSKAEFEEQTLWTLYALQEGVTSKSDWKRGNGSIRFIESFFNMKGSNEKDNISHLTLVSGNTRIKFDGTYGIKEVIKGQSIKPFKMMTFNEKGDIEAKPDAKYVTFADNYFPGTLIAAKICIKETNTEVSQNEQ